MVENWIFCWIHIARRKIENIVYPFQAVSLYHDPQLQVSEHQSYLLNLPFCALKRIFTLFRPTRYFMIEERNFVRDNHKITDFTSSCEFIPRLISH